MTSTLPVLGICAAGSNAGKTTLISQLIPELAKDGIRTSVIKHAHHRFDIDYPGKDSYKIREAGAVQTLVASDKRWALITELTRTPHQADEIDLESLLPLINPDYADLVLVEGFKNAKIPKIEVYRASLNLSPLFEHDDQILAVASDVPIHPLANIKSLNLNNLSEITHFICEHFFSYDKS